MRITPPICQIIPPHMLEHLAEHGSPDEREAALETLRVDEGLRAARAEEMLADGSAPPRRSTLPPPDAPHAQRTVHDAEQGRRLPGRAVRSEGEAPVADGDVDRVYDGFGATWDLFHEVFGRDSYDDRGALLSGTVHFEHRYNNAFWDGTQMVFGDGDGQLFTSFTTSIDIMGHELTHAVTEHESGLIYRNQAGALNEHLSDVFGSLVKQRSASTPQTAEQADWLIGADILGSGIQGVALRSMKAPGTAYDDPRLGRDPQPGHMDDFVVTSDDNGGVHINSGIPNRAFVEFALAVGGYAWDRAGRVWYATAIDPRLSADASFDDFAALTVEHALLQQGHAVAEACRASWMTVGLSVGPTTLGTALGGGMGTLAS